VPSKDGTAHDKLGLGYRFFRNSLHLHFTFSISYYLFVSSFDMPGFVGLTLVIHHSRPICPFYLTVMLFYEFHVVLSETNIVLCNKEETFTIRLVEISTIISLCPGWGELARHINAGHHLCQLRTQTSECHSVSSTTTNLDRKPPGTRNFAHKAEYYRDMSVMNSEKGSRRGRNESKIF